MIDSQGIDSPGAEEEGIIIIAIIISIIIIIIIMTRMRDLALTSP